MSLVLVSGQFLSTFDNSFRYDSLSDDFSGSALGGAGSFGGFGGGLASIRDPRQNRGKHLKKCMDLTRQITWHHCKEEEKKKNTFWLVHCLTNVNWFGVECGVLSRRLMPFCHIQSTAVSSLAKSLASFQQNHKIELIGRFGQIAWSHVVILYLLVLLFACYVHTVAVK